MIQNNFYASVRKTTVVNVDDSAHKLPPDNGPFQEFRVADWFCPEEWSKDAIFIPVKEGEPMWFDFRQNDECAVLCAVQRLNPVTGEPADLEGGLTKDPNQNYLYMPDQRWLDGYAKDGKVYQFVVTKEGVGLAVNEFVLPKHMQDSHAIGFAFYSPKNPKPKPQPVYRSMDMCKFSPDMCKIGNSSPLRNLSKGISGQGLGHWDSALHDTYGSSGQMDSFSHEVNTSGTGTQCNASPNMAGAADTDGGAAYAEEIDEVEVVDRLAEIEVDHTQFDKASMGMGGRIEQRITPDPNTVDYYHEKPAAVLTMYLCLPEQFEAIMKKGKRQDSSRKDKYVFSGEVGGVQVPLIKPE